jgi:hypothetical protein
MAVLMALVTILCAQVAVTESLSNTTAEQLKLDAMAKALKHLPNDELIRLNITLEEPIFAGTEQAVALQTAWSTRQQEIKSALGSIAQPIEYMINITNNLKNFSMTNIEDLSNSLVVLESLLSDIDNAKDYYTQGFWRDLVAGLSDDRPIAIRLGVAWVVGTAVKNSYDYQLWTLESYDTSASCLDLLLSALDNIHAAATDRDPVEYDELYKKVLYAISSATRGNVDVGDAIMNHSSLFLDKLVHIVASGSFSRELTRKVWTFVSDMLEERQYVRFGLLSVSNTTDSQIDFINSLNLIGDHFLTPTWVNLALQAITKEKEYLSLLSTERVFLPSADAAILKHSIVYISQVAHQNRAILGPESEAFLLKSLVPLVASAESNGFAEDVGPVVRELVMTLSQTSS